MTTEKIEARWHGLRCDAQRSIRYHMMRVRFFQFWSSLISFFALIAGSAVVVSILALAPDWIALTAGAVIAGTQAIELVWGLGAKARLHSSLATEFGGIEKAIVLTADQSNEEAFRRLEAEHLQIETREPPVKRWLDLICHNEIARAMGKNDVYVVPFWPRLTAQWLSGANIQPKRIAA